MTQTNSENQKERDPLHQDLLDAEQADQEHRELEQMLGRACDMFGQPIKGN